jgi:hypothetical protein
VSDKPPCPSCGRPPTFEYRLEVEQCRMWQSIHELRQKPDEREIANCMHYTAKRIAELKAALAEASERANAAQAALKRHHQAQFPPEFRAKARIE